MNKIDKKINYKQIMINKKVKFIGLDGDDTLWHNEIHFQKAQDDFCKLFKNINPKKIKKKLLEIEKKNLPIYGYGIKGFNLSLLETYIYFNKYITINKVKAILDIGKTMLTKKVQLITDVEKVLMQLKKKYKLFLITKGDYNDQQRKVKQSKLKKYFDSIIILDEKDKNTYKKILNQFKIKPSQFLMVGNSIKSDVLPVIDIKGHAIHIPYHVTWEHEISNKKILSNRYKKLNNILNILK